MSRTVGAALAALSFACGSLPTTSEGVAFLQVERPSDPTLIVGATLQLHAVALDKSGNPLEVSILWRTPDTTITVEATSGLVTAVTAGNGRVQAVVGNDELVSDFITLQVEDPPAPSRRP